MEIQRMLHLRGKKGQNTFSTTHIQFTKNNYTLGDGINGEYFYIFKANFILI